MDFYHVNLHGYFLKFYGLGEGRRAFSKESLAFQRKFAATVTTPLTEPSENFFQNFCSQKNRPPYISNSFLTRCTVDTDTPQIAAVSRMLLPALSERITLLYSSCLRSLLFTEPTLRPSLPPSAMYLARPLLRR